MSTFARADINLHLDHNGYINENVDCPECNYNIRGVHPAGVCPECGQPVANALNTLQFSDPQWIYCLASGLNWIIFSIYFSFVFTILAMMLQAMSLFQGNSPSRFASSLLLFLPVMAHVWGIWKFTTPETPAREPSVARLLTRYTLLICSALIWIPEFFVQDQIASIPPATVVLGSYQDIAAGLTNITSARFALITFLFLLASIVLFVVGNFAGLIYARQIARRIPDKKLARNTGIVMWGLMVTAALFVLMCVLGTASALMPAGLATVSAIAAIVPGCFSIIGVLVFGGWIFVLLSQFRKKLRLVGQRAAMRSVEPSLD